MSVVIVHPPGEPCIDCGRLRDPAVERCPECWGRHMAKAFLSDFKAALAVQPEEEEDGPE